MRLLNRLMHATAAVGTAAMIFTGCASDDAGGGGGFRASDVARIAQAAAVAAGEDEETAARYGQAAGELAGVAAPVSPEVEQRLGEGIALEAYTLRGRRLADENLQRYVNLVGRHIARSSGRPDVLYTFSVIDDPTPNAFAAPGGFIFITSGTLELMDDEAELAGVLAHEIAHITERHMMSIYRKSQFFGAIQATAEAADAENAEYGQWVDFGTTTLFDNGLGSRYEYEADLLGMELAALSGYNPGGLIEFLEKLQGSEKTGGWLGTTHPTIGSRLDRLRTFWQQDLGGLGGVTQRERFARMVNGSTVAGG